jgi:hypothetical protein
VRARRAERGGANQLGNSLDQLRLDNRATGGRRHCESLVSRRCASEDHEMYFDFALSLVYIACHLCLYLVYLRQRDRFCAERGIFLYHVGSFLALTAVLLARAALAPEKAALAEAMAGIALHAIYSLSFLELWALTKTGFSLRILSDIARAGSKTSQEILISHRQTSSVKKHNRLRSLLALHLLREDAGCYRLTARGHAVASALAALSRSAGTQETG